VAEKCMSPSEILEGIQHHVQTMQYDLDQRDFIEHLNKPRCFFCEPPDTLQEEIDKMKLEVPA